MLEEEMVSDGKKCVGAPNRSIRGGFSKDSFFPLVRIQGRLNAPTFIDMLTENFLPNKEDILPDGHLFQHATVHIARQWVEDESIQLLDCCHTLRMRIYLRMFGSNEIHS